MATRLKNNSVSIVPNVASDVVDTSDFSGLNKDWMQYVKFVDASSYKELQQDSVHQVLQELQELYPKLKIRVPNDKPYVLDIVQFSKNPDVLRQKSRSLPKEYLASPEFKYFALLMLFTLLLSEDAIGTPGIGLSAIQVGVPWQMFWAYLAKLDKWELVVNPSLEPHDNTEVTAKEGCLSITGITVPVPRMRAIKAKYLNGFGIKNKLVLKGFDARVFQHEYDHLMGRLIVDYK